MGVLLIFSVAPDDTGVFMCEHTSDQNGSVVTALVPTKWLYNPVGTSAEPQVSCCLLYLTFDVCLSRASV